MNWSDYEAVWKRQPLPLGNEANLNELLESFEAKRRKLHAALLVRDYSEAGAGVLVSIACAFIWWKMGTAGWPIGIALLLVLGVSGVFVRERVRIKRFRFGADAALLAKVEADLALLRHQRHLLHTIWWWHLGPIFAATLIVHFTLALHSPPWAPQRDPIFNGGFVGFYLLLVWLAWWINYRTGRKRLDPRIEELEKLRHSLLGES